MYRKEQINFEDLDIKNPFEKCQLAREKYADNLTRIIDSQQVGFVLAINNKWGAGKTTFINMWRLKLENVCQYSTVYLNAWENDFDDNPLSTLIAEFKSLEKVNKNSSINFDSVLEKASIFSKNLAPAITIGLAKKFAGHESVDAIINGITNGATDIFTNEVDTYLKKKKDLTILKKQLQKYVEKNANGKNLIFFIDELDRCRPNYAVSLLEQIKHFFNVPNIVFVLSIDKEQLGHAVRGVYGSEKIEAVTYLKRFIDIEYSLPNPDAYMYSKHLIKLFNIEELLEKNNNISNDENKALLSYVCEIFLNSHNVSLRHIDRIFSYLSIVLRGFKPSDYLPIELLIYLVFLKVEHNNQYDDIQNKILTTDQVRTGLKKFYIESDIAMLNSLICRTEAMILIYYYNYKHPRNKNQNIIESISSVFKNEGMTENVKNSIKFINNVGTEFYSIEELINKINFIDNLEFN